MKNKIIWFGIYILSGIIQITIILLAEVIAELTFAKGAWVPAGIILFAPVYLVIFLLVNTILIIKKNIKWIKIIDIGLLTGIIIEISGLYTPVLFHLFGLTGTIYNSSVIRELLFLH